MFATKGGNVVYACTADVEVKNVVVKKAIRFSERIMSIAQKPMEEQKLLLDQTFESWRGHQEQVDDLTILGVRV